MVLQGVIRRGIGLFEVLGGYVLDMYRGVLLQLVVYQWETTADIGGLHIDPIALGLGEGLLNAILGVYRRSASGYLDVEVLLVLGGLRDAMQVLLLEI